MAAPQKLINGLTDLGMEKMQEYLDHYSELVNKGEKRYYIQSAFSLPDADKVKQEKASLLNVNDSFKKIIIVKDIIKPQRDENGIVTINLYDFLLNENSLDL